MIPRLFLIICVFSPAAAHAASYNKVQDINVTWMYSYEIEADDQEIPIHFSMRKCQSPKSGVGNSSPVDGCFTTEGEARIAADQYAILTEKRYEQAFALQSPSLWQKAVNYLRNKI